MLSISNALDRTDKMIVSLTENNAAMEKLEERTLQLASFGGLSALDVRKDEEENRGNEEDEQESMILSSSLNPTGTPKHELYIAQGWPPR